MNPIKAISAGLIFIALLSGIVVSAEFSLKKEGDSINATEYYEMLGGATYNLTFSSPGWLWGETIKTVPVVWKGRNFDANSESVAIPAGIDKNNFRAELWETNCRDGERIVATLEV